MKFFEKHIWPLKHVKSSCSDVIYLFVHIRGWWQVEGGLHNPLRSLRVPGHGDNSTAVFQGFMNEVFREFLHRSIIVYIDDILIYSQNLAEHRHHIKQVLEHLRKHHLYLKLEKCEFHRSMVQFLGYILSAYGIQMDQEKVQAIRDWPQPHSIKELQWFLGFANFYLGMGIVNVLTVLLLLSIQLIDPVL